MSDKHAPHVEQAMSEYAGTTNDEQRKAALKRMAAAGVAPPEPAADSEDVDAEASEVPSARSTPPKGRTARPKIAG